MALIPFLCLAYPCDVKGGVDPVAFVRQILECRNDEIRKAVCQVLRVRETIDDAGLLQRAVDQRENWNHTVTQDSTNMRTDFQHALNFTDDQVARISSCFITELNDEHISTLRSFLLCYDHGFHRGIRFLYLIGHAISNRGATILRRYPTNDHPKEGEKESKVWPWRLYDCSNQGGIGKSPSEVTRKAQRGDLVVFSSGLLTPEWVIDVLQEAELQRENQFYNTIVIVVDACYSGTWVDRMRLALNGNSLQYTRILLQTSCGPDEGAYGQSFTPYFVNQNLDTHYKVDQEAPTQTPHFFDSTNPNNPGLPPQNIPIGTTGGIFFRFINEPIGRGGGNARSRNHTFRKFVPFN